MVGRALRIAGLVAIFAAAYVLHLFGLAGPVAAGYYAKVACSALYVSGRGLGSVLAEDLAIDHPLGGLMDVHVDSGDNLVRATVAGLFERQAVYRPGLGCTLAGSYSITELKQQAAGFFPPAMMGQPEMIAWPAGDADSVDGLPSGVDQPRLALAIDQAFAEPDPKRPARTRAVVVVYRGRVVAERYSRGINKDTPLAGWSMTKTIINALTGILAGEGRLLLDSPAATPEWSNPVDPRHSITIENLLQMSSGLEFTEDYFDLTADAPVMLFRSPSAGAYAARKRLAEPPGERWKYSSGTSNILSRIIRDTVGGSLADYWGFPRRVLFDRIGMNSAVLEPDPSGVFAGSSFCYATARDWARFGLLYLQDGVWQGERVLPEGWVKYSTSPAPSAPGGRFGAHVWLNAGSPDNEANRRWPGLPRDLFYLSGFEGQHVVVVPSAELVMVRLGCSREPTTWSLERFAGSVLDAVDR